jgi:hypothetical protein
LPSSSRSDRIWNALAEVALNRCCEEIARIAQTASGKIVCRVGGWDGAVEAAVYVERKGVVVFKFPSQALTGAGAGAFLSFGLG